MTVSNACHFSFDCDHLRSLLLKSRRSTTNVTAAPNSEPAAAIENPFMPYAYPQSVIRVVWPTAGGKEMTTARVAQTMREPQGATWQQSEEELTEHRE